jgi:signal transduction histidine kinase
MTSFRINKANIFAFVFVLLSLGLFAEISSRHDFSLTVLLPALSGLFFIFLGVGIYFYLFPRAGLLPLLAFHFLVGIYFIILPEEQLTSLFSPLGLVCLAMIPPTMIHFTFLISETLIEIRKRFFLFLIPYGVSLVMLVWIRSNVVMVAYLGLAYFSWLIRLLMIFRSPHFELDRIIARYLLFGQLIGFIIPSGIAGVIFLKWGPFPLNLVAPFILLFPISLWMGFVPSKRQEMETYLVQTEKRIGYGSLLAGLAHELKNPLTFIYAHLEPLRELSIYLKSHPPPPGEKVPSILRDFDKMIDNMEEGVTRAQGLIEKVRYFPKPRPEKKEEVDLNPLIDRSIELLSPKWKDRIIIEKKFEEIPKVRGFSGELAQVFTNLIANACDATPLGGLIEVSTHKAAAGVKISVRDTGKGIPKREIDRIFDPFFTTKEQGKGSGLGLAITLQIIKSHKGKIQVKSEVGKGTEFLVFLPY